MPRASFALRRGRPPWIALVWSTLVASGLLVAGCSLTGDELDPERVVAGLEDDGNAGTGPSRPAPEPDDATGGADATDGGPDECSNGELSGCDLPLTVAECSDNAECASGRCVDGSCAEATCDDATRNGSESDVDCGGGCGSTCVAGRACGGDADCADDLLCRSGECVTPSCTDGVHNGDETAGDCGGSCPGCPLEVACQIDADCASGYCADDDRCAEPSCNDERRNGDESDIDCGGSCEEVCGEGNDCRQGSDCQSGVCEDRNCGPGDDPCCQPPRCDDGVRNGTEPVVDCGNGACGLCPVASPCTASAECASGLCAAGSCVEPCADGNQNGTETDVDCGGGSAQCRRCNVGERCVNGGDCGSGSCLGGICSNCFDGVQNGSETDVDCGGACGDCNPGQLCAADGDCNGNACQDGRCCGGRERDCTRCAERLSPGLTCDNTNDQGTANGCRTFLQCLRANEICTVRHAPGCSDDPNGVCNHLTYGGNGSTGVSLADNILGNAQCLF